ncbi:hypothetical protein KEM55_007731 [Ascosphaera atra]|nr:hypothetical protein KEM55_007731 [Ascosphaera atra]
MVQLQPIFKRAYWFLVITGAIYVTAFYFATYPAVQRSFLYVNRLNPSWAHWHDVNDVEKFGFLPHQIQPFTVTTPDNETLYAWHILPAHLAHEHEAFLKARTTRGPAHNFSETGSFELLASDPDARVVSTATPWTWPAASARRPTGRCWLPPRPRAMSTSSRSTTAATVSAPAFPRRPV